MADRVDMMPTCPSSCVFGETLAFKVIIITSSSSSSDSNSSVAHYRSVAVSVSDAAMPCCLGTSMET